MVYITLLFNLQPFCFPGVIVSHSCYVSLNHVHFNVSFALPSGIFSDNTDNDNNNNSSVENTKTLFRFSTPPTEFNNKSDNKAVQQYFNRSSYSLNSHSSRKRRRRMSQENTFSKNSTSNSSNSKISINNINYNNSNTSISNSNNTDNNNNIDTDSTSLVHLQHYLEKSFKAELVYRDYLKKTFVKGDFCITSYNPSSIIKLPVIGSVDCGLFHIRDNNLYEIR